MSAMPLAERPAAGAHGIETMSSCSSRRQVISRRCSATGGAPTPVTALIGGDTTHRWPWFLPDGQYFLFLALGEGPPQLRLGSLTSTESTPIGAIRTSAMYAAGHLLFVDDTLMAQPFDTRSRQLTGNPIPLNARVGSTFRRPGASQSQCPTRICSRIATRCKTNRC